MGKTLPAISPTRKRVLIVEDDPAWRQLLTETLEDMGLQADSAADARTAIAMLHQQAYVLAVVDMSLDPKDHRDRGGFQVLDALAA
ncbi:MAG TPA: response regulator, partial [Thermoflexus sp.]|nr:response regulator [Thermoflexus sp.]